MSHQFYVPTDKIVDTTAIFDSPQEVNHIINVLRYKIGSELRIFDGRGNVCLGTIVSIKPGKIQVTINKWLTPQTEPHLDITVNIGIIKPTKFEFLLQKLTELGVKTIVPLITQRTVPNFKNNVQHKQSRWQKIVVESVKQCNGIYIPDIKKPQNFNRVVESDTTTNLKLVFTEKTGRGEKFPAVLKKINPPPRIVSIYIGPEGGFTDEELGYVHQSGAVKVNLGDRILRTETATLFTVAVLLYEYDIW